ncbi:DUF1120 domain-containing protein [Herbaspirillum sp. alder98]|uniref:DUF1120 domain-containing protein n=1 Tax=Herbaspirillum sp. alder98 TaxID=2913096 RepID=UPI001CD8F142|nr:DUF1120 domain-containing protein [Herbaspirillum sp. alder98]MCA1322979.1 DUF1120 domain-containing protein [Herbaspirillum sp. alder98]
MHRKLLTLASLRRPAVITLLALLSSAAQATGTVAMEVVTTVTPAACTPALSHGGEANYGVRDSSILRPGQITALPPLSLRLTINCDVAALFAIRLTDNRSGSLVPGIVASGSGNSALTDDVNFGLGMASGANIGGYAISFDPTSYTGDYRAVQLMASADGVTWHHHASGLGSKQQLLSWGATGAGNISAYRAVEGMLTVRPFINKPEHLKLNNEIELNGSTTLELNYL